jgi:hypothetical protein
MNPPTTNLTPQELDALLQWRAGLQIAFDLPHESNQTLHMPFTEQYASWTLSALQKIISSLPPSVP